jgi:hypothetical protein
MEKQIKIIDKQNTEDKFIEVRFTLKDLNWFLREAEKISVDEEMDAYHICDESNMAWGSCTGSTLVFPCVELVHEDDLFCQIKLIYSIKYQRFDVYELNEDGYLIEFEPGYIDSDDINVESNRDFQVFFDNDFMEKFISGIYELKIKEYISEKQKALHNILTEYTNVSANGYKPAQEPTFQAILEADIKKEDDNIANVRSKLACGDCEECNAASLIRAYENRKSKIAKELEFLKQELKSES